MLGSKALRLLKRSIKRNSAMVRDAAKQLLPTNGEKKLICPPVIPSESRSDLYRGTANRNRSGFTLIEILVAIALVAVMATLVIPNILRLMPRHDRDQFIATMQTMVQNAWQSALASGKIHRISVDIDKRTMTVSQATGAKDAKGELEFAPAKIYYAPRSMQWPAHIQIKQFIIEGFDEMGRYGGGRKTTETWFFIMPDGLAQSVVINAIDIKDVRNGKPRQFSLVLSPFTGAFKKYDTFQK